MSSATGYGTSHRNLLYFDGNDERYELWEVKFKAHLRLQKLSSVITDDRDDTSKFKDKNSQVFAELVQVLDDKSLSLVIREADDDGKLALEILHNHYLGRSKPRIILLYTELTTLQKKTDETATDYFLRAEKSATALKQAGEAVSDGLLVAMLLKGLPSEYSAFTTVITQKSEDMTFSEFKTALKSFEETERGRCLKGSENIMKTEVRTLRCYTCGSEGHKK